MKSLLSALAVLTSCLCWAIPCLRSSARPASPDPAQLEPTYLGLYLQGHKIGYSSFISVPANWKGRQVERSDSRTIMDAGLLGTPLKIQIDSQTYTDGAEPLEMKFDMESDGRKQLLDAVFSPKTVRVDVDNSGAKSSRVLPRPNGPIADDPIEVVLKGGKSQKVYVLDPTTASFVENEVHLKGQGTLIVDGKTVSATVVEIVDPRATETVYVDALGNILKAEGPMGLTMLPESAKEAMSIPSKYSPDVDLAYSTCVVPTGHLDNPVHTQALDLNISGANLSRIPSEAGQTVKGVANGWLVHIEPHQVGDGGTIRQADAGMSAFLKPDLDMPSDRLEFRRLSKQVVGKQKHVEPAALAIKDWVYNHMRPNAGIGVLRDASEVLKTREGVCRDYAILTCTLLRSAGIPARLASGMVDWDGTFYYHAWNEIWNGRHWIGIDSTTPDRDFSATHVKLAEGTVAQAFTFGVLDKVKVQILSSRG